VHPAMNTPNTPRTKDVPQAAAPALRAPAHADGGVVRVAGVLVICDSLERIGIIPVHVLLVFWGFQTVSTNRVLGKGQIGGDG